MSSLSQPFNSTEFNFNKAKAEEMLMTLRPVNASANFNQDTTSNGNTTSSETQHVILINVSPLEYGHVLLVPNFTKNQPQIITLDGLRISLEMLMLSRSW